MSRTFQVQKLEDRIAPSVCNLFGGVLDCGDGHSGGGSGSGDSGCLLSLPNLSNLDLPNLGGLGGDGSGGGGDGGDCLIDLDGLLGDTGVPGVSDILPADGIPQLPHIPTTSDLPFDLPGGDITDLDATLIKNLDIGDTTTHEGPLGLNADNSVYGFASLERIQADGHVLSYVCETPLLEIEPACVIINTGLDTDAGSPPTW